MTHLARLVLAVFLLTFVAARVLTTRQRSEASITY